jgi:DNA-binding PadR family transcriptional regulator
MLTEPFSVVRLFVLGLLIDSNRHGYEVVAVAERWAVHRWAGISIGSIYNALRQLTKAGFVEVAKVEKEGKRPERSVYKITASGQIECRRMIEHGLGSLEYESREVDMALAFAHLIPAEVRKAKLEDRLGPLVERKQQLQGFADSYEACLSESRPDLASFRELRIQQPWIFCGIKHGLARLTVEEAWTRDLILEVGSWNTSQQLQPSNQS